VFNYCFDYVNAAYLVALFESQTLWRRMINLVGSGRKNSIVLFPWPLKMGPIHCPETSVRNYRYSLRNRPEEGISHSVLNLNSIPAFAWRHWRKARKN